MYLSDSLTIKLKSSQLNIAKRADIQGAILHFHE